MTIATGTRLGPYEIVEWLGAGGMGEVYRARDPRLARDVAIKLIAGSLALDPDRVNRFEQEARTAGQLNHPNVLAVYDVGSYAGCPYIVSELLEGETLRHRLENGALPVRKAIEYARQTAEGLAAAHDRKIIHRDLKPDNLFVTTDDRIKILDFGISKLTQPAEETTAHSRTDTADGVVHGTTGYMSPEQIRGEIVDARSDIFSLGIVVHEALAGRALFARPTPAETVAAVLKEEPPALQSTVPSPGLARIVERCLEKTREARFQSARDLAFALEGLTDGSGAAASTTSSGGARRIVQGGAPWMLAGVMACGLAAVLLTTPGGAKPVTVPAMLLNIDLGTDALLPPGNLQFGDSAALSPDGQTIVFVAQSKDGVPQLYRRKLNELDAHLMPGTEGAVAPFFSPTAEWVAFFAAGKLKKVATTGGAAETLANAPNQRGASWSEDGTIVFSADKVAGTPLLRVSSDGERTAKPVTTLADGEVLHVWPQVLPGGRQVLFTATRSEGEFNDAYLVVQNIPSGARTIVLRGGYHGRYVETGRNAGHLVYVKDATLVAVPFDLDRLQSTGPAVSVIPGLASNRPTGGAQFSLSRAGTLLYQADAPADAAAAMGLGSPIYWLDRDGSSRPLMTTPENWFNLAFSPDGSKLAMEIRNGPSYISIYDPATDHVTRLTADSIPAEKPVWSPRGGFIVYASKRGDGATTNLWLQRADAQGKPQQLTENSNQKRPGSWSRDGRFLAFEELRDGTNWDVMILPMEGSDAVGWKPGKPHEFLSSASSEREPMFSPDDRWIAYELWASGRSEVLVSPFPRQGTAITISADHGAKPTWSRDRKQLFYEVRDGTIMVADYSDAGGSLQPEKARRWSDVLHRVRGANNRMFALYPDGDRFAIAPRDTARPARILMFQNFADELRRRVPPGRQ